MCWTRCKWECIEVCRSELSSPSWGTNHEKADARVHWMIKRLPCLLDTMYKTICTGQYYPILRWLLEPGGFTLFLQLICGKLWFHSETAVWICFSLLGGTGWVFMAQWDLRVSFVSVTPGAEIPSRVRKISTGTMLSFPFSRDAFKMQNCYSLGYHCGFSI